MLERNIFTCHYCSIVQAHRRYRPDRPPFLKGQHRQRYIEFLQKQYLLKFSIVLFPLLIIVTSVRFNGKVLPRARLTIDQLFVAGQLSCQIDRRGALGFKTCPLLTLSRLTFMSDKRESAQSQQRPLRKSNAAIDPFLPSEGADDSSWLSLN